MSNQFPSLQEINDWLIIGMRPEEDGEAVTVGSSNELGANRSVLTSNTDYDGPDPTVINGANTNIFPLISFVDGPFAGDEGLSRAASPSGLRGEFIPSPEDGDDPEENRWFTGPPKPRDNQTPEGESYPNNPESGPDVDYLPHFQQQRQVRTVRGVDWSGNVAVTSQTGEFSLQDMSIFGDTGFASRSTAAAVNISNSYYFPTGSLDGLLMSDATPNPQRGWSAGIDFDDLLQDLRNWRDFIRGLDAERNLLQDIPGLDLNNRNSIDDDRFAYVVPDAWDTNDDGIILIEAPDIGEDFEVNNSDWIIEGTGNKLIIFRIRGEANMEMANSSIMLGKQFAENIGFRRTGVLFTKVHPEEEFTSPSGSSDTVFDLSNVVMNGVGLWDLNTIGDADTDIPYPGDANRTDQDNYTDIQHSNTQGCGQFISPFVSMQNVRWMHCEVFDPEVVIEPDIDLKKQVSVDEGQTWFDAGTPPGPSVSEDRDPFFRFVVTNDGNVTLGDITLDDTELGTINIPTTTLAPGESFGVVVVGSWQAGQQFNEAEVVGVFEDVPYTDTDVAHYFGVVEPSISIDKFVSVDGGQTWFDVDTPPGPVLPPDQEPFFKFVVTNDGGATLSDVTITDSKLGLISTIDFLQPGEVETIILPDM